MKKKPKLRTVSVYESLGYKNHREMTTKADLVMEIEKEIKKRKLTQEQAALLIGISQPKLSDLLRGRFRGYSVEKLMHFLNFLDKDVEIIIKPKQTNHAARTIVYAFPTRGRHLSPKRLSR